MSSMTIYISITTVFLISIAVATHFDLNFDILNNTDFNRTFDNSTFEDGLELAYDGPKTRRLIQNDTFIIIKEPDSDYRLRLTCTNNAFTFDVWGQGEYAGYIMKSADESGVMTVDLDFQDVQTITVKFMHYDTGIYKVKLFEGLTTQTYEKEILDFGVFHYWPSCIYVYECAHCIHSWNIHKPGMPEQAVL
uniref:Galectin n=1 Tax=Panagrellus redivivus TaxID=6233 RepID=A0A7E4VJ88_PANRE